VGGQDMFLVSAGLGPVAFGVKCRCTYLRARMLLFLAQLAGMAEGGSGRMWH